MPTKSPFPDVEIPNVDLWTFMLERKDRPFPEDKCEFSGPAITTPLTIVLTVMYVDAETDRTYTFSELKATALSFGHGLKALWDWRKGDVLALFTPNSIDTPPIMWGCHWAGGVLSPANPAYTAEELAHQLKDSGARALATQKSLLPTALKAAAIAGIEQDMVILLGDERDSEGRFKHFTSVRNISGATRYRKSKIKPDTDLAFLVYSSGTTGLPKGVMLTHRNIIANVLQNGAIEGGHLDPVGGIEGQGERILAFLPFFHIYGLTCLVHQCLYIGGVLVVMARFDLQRFCELIEKHKISFVFLVPPIVLALAKSPIVTKYDLSSVRMTNSGAAPLTQELVDGVWKRLKMKVKQGYGMSEASPTTHSQPWDEWDTSIGSVGKMLPNQTAMYVGPDEKEVPVGQVGELWIKGPNIFKGYLNNEEGTKSSLTSDGYYKTGDVGYQDDKGNFFITDRVKELIKYKGFQVAPAELEGLLVDHTDVQDAGVIGIYDKNQATELPRAYIVSSKKDEKTAEDIQTWLAGKVANHKRLRGGIRFVDEIPKSASGKILRRMLKETARREEQTGKAKL